MMSYEEAAARYDATLTQYRSALPDLEGKPYSAAIKTAWRNDLRQRFRGISSALTRSIGYAYESADGRQATTYDVDHAIPLVIVHGKIIEATRISEIEDIIRRLVIGVRLTHAEHKNLNKHFKMKMPDGWNGDPLARYTAIGLHVTRV
jgi:hypothetical protein